VCPIHRQQQRRAAGLLLSAVRSGDIDEQQRARSAVTVRQHSASSVSQTPLAELTYFGLKLPMR